MLKDEIPDQVNKELARAEQARQQQNEGMARVCARRAAGFMAQFYLEKMGMDIQKINALEALYIFSQKNELPASLRRSAELLTMRVTPEHQLPIDADLIHEAKKFIQELKCWMEDQID